MSSGVGLLSLPEDLLVDQILSLIPFEGLISCIFTCRQLGSIVNSSLLLDYHRALAVAGMVDNPQHSNNDISLFERLNLLKTWKSNWLTLSCSWKRYIVCDINPTHLLVSLANQSGVLIRKPRDWYIHPQALYFHRLPSSEKAVFDWRNAVKLESTETNIHLFAPSHVLTVDEHSLLAYIMDNSSNLEAAVHLVEYPSLTPHPLATIPILPWGQIFRSEDKATMLVCGANIAVSFAAQETLPGRQLLVWDWKTGTQRASMTLADRNQTSAYIAYLREDLLLSVSIRTKLIDVYWIPPLGSSPFVNSAPKKGHIIEDVGQEQDENPEDDTYILEDDIHIPLIQSYSLPLFNPDDCYHLECTSAPCPSSKFFVGNAKPFTSDPKSALLCFVFLTETSVERYSLVMHRQALLDLVLSKWNIDPVQNTFAHVHIPWNEWGPKRTRVFSDPSESTRRGLPPCAVFGTRRVQLTTETDIEVQQFAPYAIVEMRMAHRDSIYSESMNTRPRDESHRTSKATTQIRLVDRDEPTMALGSFFREPVQTTLPYISTILRNPQIEGPLGMRHDSLLLDEDRIVRVCELGSGKGLDIMYLS